MFEEHVKMLQTQMQNAATLSSLRLVASTLLQFWVVKVLLDFAREDDVNLKMFEDVSQIQSITFYVALSSGWPYQQVLGYCLTIHACVSNIDINCFLIRSRLQRCGSRLRAKPLRNAFVSTASLVETLGEIKMERLGEASACISKVDVFKRDSEKCKLEGSDVFSFMFVFAETMWMTVTNSNINKLVGLWQKRRFFFLSRNGSHQRHSYSTCIFF